MRGSKSRRRACRFNRHRTRPFAADVNFFKADGHALARLQAAA
jgi:hypothetical protein